VSILLIHGVGGRPRSWDMVLGHLDPGLRRQAHAVDVTVSAGQSVAAVARVIMAKHPGSHVLARIFREMLWVSGCRYAKVPVLQGIIGLL
jgi:hypothetical protein